LHLNVFEQPDEKIFSTPFKKWKMRGCEAEKMREEISSELVGRGAFTLPEKGG